MKLNVPLHHHVLTAIVYSAALSNAYVDPRSYISGGLPLSSHALSLDVPDDGSHHPPIVWNDVSGADGSDIISSAALGEKRPKKKDDAHITTATNTSADSLSLSFDRSLHKDRLFRQCLLAIVAYMAVGIVGFSRVFEQWSIVDSVYFSVVTFTTVG
jgi:hypothetical protein